MGRTENRQVLWRDGSLDELVAMLSGPALSVRIEVLVQSGIGERVVGEVHMVAGGIADAVAGDRRGEQAMEYLLGRPQSGFRIEHCAPDPEGGTLSPPGPEEGTLAGRSIAEIMRYCENYVMTCLLDVWRGNERATISYRRGEIASITVNGTDAPARLSEVLAWTEGMYNLVLPPLILPSVPRAVRARTAPAGAAVPPPVPAAAMSALASAQQTVKKTIAMLSPEVAKRRGTLYGMPVDVFGKSRQRVVGERFTDVGMPTAVGVPVLPAEGSAPSSPPPPSTPSVAPQPAPSRPTLFGRLEHKDANPPEAEAQAVTAVRVHMKSEEILPVPAPDPPSRPTTGQATKVVPPRPPAPPPPASPVPTNTVAAPEPASPAPPVITAGADLVRTTAPGYTASGSQALPPLSRPRGQHPPAMRRPQSARRTEFAQSMLEQQWVAYTGFGIGVGIVLLVAYLVLR
jgi:hypothetical protein